MKSKLVKFLIINLLLSSFTSTSSLKLPNPSPTVLIVNHLNYLRYDYLSNPTSLRTNGYPFYSSDSRELNRTTEYNHQYSINESPNNLDLILTGRLDEELANRLENQVATARTNDDDQHDQHEDFNELFNQSNPQNNLLNVQLNSDQHLLNGQLNNSQLNENQQQISLNDESNVSTPSNEIITGQLDEQTTDQLTQFNNQQFTDQTDQNNNSNEQSDLNNNLSNLIITNSTTDGQQRLLELNLLQQTEPSLSLILDSNSPFLNNVQESDVTAKESSNNTPINSVQLSNNDFPAFIEDLDDLLNSSNFDLFEYTKSNDEHNPLLDTTNILLPDDLDDLTNLYQFDDLDFPTDQENTLQPLNDNSEDLSSVINQNLHINQNEAYDQSTTSNQLNSDNYIHELLSDEDLQMIGFSNLHQPHLDDCLNDNLDLTNEDHIEVSSDSAISSMSRSEWFDSGSDSSSHFDDQFKAQRDHCLEDEFNLCPSSVPNNTNEALFDYELTDSNYDLYARDDNVFDLNLDETLRSDSINFNSIRGIEENGILTSDNALQVVRHNHTYTSAEPVVESEQPEQASTSKAKSLNDRPQNSRASNQQNSLETIRNRRLYSSESSRFDLISVTSETSSAGESYERSLSRDEKKAKQLNIPISVCDIINMPIDEFNEILTKYDLNEAQLTLIRDIRRRGKNKVAAQNCRKRKINQIEVLQSEVGNLQTQKSDLLTYYDKLFTIKDMAFNKYQKLYEFICERTQTNAALLANFELNFKMPTASRNGSDEGACGGFNETRRFDENDNNQLNEMPTNRMMLLKNVKKEPMDYKEALAMN